MGYRLLPMRNIVIGPCWPHSGRKYQVWEGDRVILETDDEDKAIRKAQCLRD